ncbi:predicted protein [Aspergillus terreus NIH2624]|uniref:Chorismate-utilising enzyme C-terminal domain-containing protein n=1 Tax=Aspergillus terreus (strain NIH 2624 / FGSC A1156) TaxID=341663 RepID=Q0CU05_ASPTN|nr:uncharacterized protein ATEG_02829 [Aspergillus terreus NIH2624]EAU36103.1 predicted protein [Aspergillus terreus NIH2624]
MARLLREYTLPGVEDPLRTTAALLDDYKRGSYYAYEYGDTWYIGLSSHASLVVDPAGETATIIDKDGTKLSTPVTEPLGQIATRFVSEHGGHGKVFGQVGFNYGARTKGRTYEPGQWPLLSLMIPRTQVALRKDTITVTGYYEEEAKEVCSFLQHGSTHHEVTTESRIRHPPLDLQANSADYKTRVAKAISDIDRGAYSKAVCSRVVPVPTRVNMAATLLHGRRSNTPARTFSLSHGGIQATGFSPEVLLSVRNGRAFTEVVAGTRSVDPANLENSRTKLLYDTKEVLEHVTVVKGFSKQLAQSCVPGSVSIRDFMTVIDRGNVHHLFSHVSGHLPTSRSVWDTLGDMLGSVASPPPPGQAFDDMMQALEPRPRELYFGAVVMLDPDADFFEAALVLRTVFQDTSRQWLQAGAAVTRHSNPEREFAETCEKLMSMAPYVIVDTTKFDG